MRAFLQVRDTQIELMRGEIKALQVDNTQMRYELLCSKCQRIDILIWNCIPPSIRNLPKKSFKLYIHDCFKSFHEHTNNYPVLPTLLGQMQHIQNRP